ncbi:MAG: RNA polymerase, sigma-24 subunit, ECF subfamily [Parcubacteria group bacterium GW2011_GWA2_47_10]|nr:MAG: RNA polymerase, sigma-24 subunit, ECF subfamily [Parcubacteria group bacterium GW2011_GWA2_47_10]
MFAVYCWKRCHDYGILRTMEHTTDLELVQYYLNGDEKSLEVLIQQYLKPIHGFVYRYVGNRQDTEEVTQEVFVKVWRNLKKYDQSQNFKTWLFSIAKNTAIDFLKKKKTVPFSAFETEDGENPVLAGIVDANALPDELMQKKDVADVVTRSLATLSPRYRTVLALRYTNQFTFREIAESLREPLDTVKSRHRRALGMLKKYFVN